MFCCIFVSNCKSLTSTMGCFKMLVSSFSPSANSNPTSITHLKSRFLQEASLILPGWKQSLFSLSPYSTAWYLMVKIQFTWLFAVASTETKPYEPHTWLINSISINLGNGQWESYAGDKHGLWAQRMMALNPCFPRVSLGKSLGLSELWIPGNNTISGVRSLCICCLNKSWCTYRRSSIKCK